MFQAKARRHFYCYIFWGGPASTTAWFSDHSLLFCLDNGRPLESLHEFVSIFLLIYVFGVPHDFLFYSFLIFKNPAKISRDRWGCLSLFSSLYMYLPDW